MSQLLEQMINERASDEGRIVHRQKEVALLCQGIFVRKTKQTNREDRKLPAWNVICHGVPS